MCLAVPSKVLNVEKNGVSLEVLGERTQAKISPLWDKKVSVGDYVLVQAGFVTELLEEDTAIKSLEAWSDVLKNVHM